MTRKVLLSIASIFLVWQSYRILYNIHHLTTEAWSILLLVAWLLNLFITGIFAFAGFAFPTQKLLPPSYYKIYAPEKLKKSYQWLRVDLFRKFLLATLWRNHDQRKKYFDGKKNGIQNLVEQSMKSEFGHLIPFILINFINVYLISIGAVKLGICSFAINIIGNLYPVILQRHHRMRIEKIQRRYRKP